jgi:hypothetical protein
MLLSGCFMVLSLTPWSRLSLTRVNVANNLSYWDVTLMLYLVDGCDLTKIAALLFLVSKGVIVVDIFKHFKHRLMCFWCQDFQPELVTED